MNIASYCIKKKKNSSDGGAHPLSTFTDHYFSNKDACEGEYNKKRYYAHKAFKPKRETEKPIDL